MNLYIIEKNLGNNIIYSQLCVPLQIAKKNNELHNEVLLLPYKFKNNYEIDNLNINYYNSNAEKFKFIFLHKSQITSMYTRSLLEFYMIFIFKLILIKNWNIRLDFRGLLSDESYLRNNNKLRKKIFEILEYYALRFASSVSTVSEEFMKLLKEKYKYKKDIIVTPCCTVYNTLKEVSNNEELKFVYVGSMAKWQMFEKIAEVFNHLSQNVKNVKLTVVTNEIENAEEICKNIGVEASIFSLKNYEVSNFLKTQDFGFLLRDDILLNNVASPVKFLEYISNGVIPIISEGIGDYSKLVKDKNIGIIYNENIIDLVNDVQEIVIDKDIYQKLYNVSKNYTWEKYYKNFII